MKHYNFILAGGGAAGLSLAYHLSQSALRDQSILIIDQHVKNRNDHTWCSWTKDPTPFDNITYRTWDKLAFYGEDYETVLELSPYHYRMVRALDFYRFTRETLNSHSNVDFMMGKVERIADGDRHAEVLVNELTFSGDWIFDSRHDVADYRPLSNRYHYLTQHFLGWEIETQRPVFNPEIPNFFDFRTPQHGAMRFVYVLPFSEYRALVEYTLFSSQLLPLADYEYGLKAYIRDVLGVHSYQILAEERDLIPMTDHPFPRRAGRHVMNIGTRGGRVKATTGFAFQRIQRDCAAIVHSLLTHEHPFDIPTPAARYRTFDAMLLQILYRHGDLSKRVFTDIFKKNPVDRIFRFLDEQGNLWENLQLMASVPPWPFMRAWLKLKLFHRV